MLGSLFAARSTQPFDGFVVTEGRRVKKMFRLILSIILVGVFVLSAFPQATPTLNLSVNIDDPVFQRGHVAMVHVKINWGPVPDAKPETLRSVSIQLTKRRTKPDDCHRGDCIGATFSLPEQRAPKNGDVIEFDVALNDLYWNDIISSGFDLSQPRNMFDVIPGGSYSLSVSTGFRANYSTKRDPRVIEVTSNSISVEMR
jgi:hypothetical protein